MRYAATVERVIQATLIVDAESEDQAWARANDKVEAEMIGSAEWHLINEEVVDIERLKDSRQSAITTKYRCYEIVEHGKREWLQFHVVDPFGNTLFRATSIIGARKRIDRLLA